MSKANEKALDWLPKRKDGRKKCYRCNDDDIRSIYARGYRKAEKDLELTWEDAKEIYCIALNLREHLGASVFGQPFYEEVLRRYKDFKERKEK